MIRKYYALGLLIITLQVLAFLSSYFVTGPAVDGWYQSINKSSLTPPDWVFAPVWTILYILLATSLWLLWRNRSLSTAKTAIALFLLQLVANYAWSFIFFGLGAFGAAFTVLLFMDVCAAATAVLAWRFNRTVTYLLLPYLVWIFFATYLTWTVMRLNA